MQQFQSISLEAANPFLAEYGTNTSSSFLGKLAPPSHAGLKSVARDSEGRIRIVRSAGKYSVKTTDGVTTEVERLSIWICDPTTATFVMLDTADKTATVQAPRENPLRVIKPDHGHGEPFCARLFAMHEHSPRGKVEDLGHQTIAGYDTIGIRVHYTPLGAAGSETSASSYNELLVFGCPGGGSPAYQRI